MLFGSPYILWGLTALSIPVIVHLFDFRRYRKVRFSDNYLLQELLEKNKRQSRIRRLIIMSLRMLFIAALVFAFARPYIPSAAGTASKGSHLYVSIYVDNSLSMEISNGNTDLLEQARSKAREVVQAYPVGTLFRLITNDFSGDFERFVPQDECLNMLHQVEFSSFSRRMSQVLSRMTDLADRNAPGAIHHYYVISDFQKATADIQKFSNRKLPVFLMPLEHTNPANIAVDSVWFSGPLQLENNMLTISARVRNYSDGLLEKIPVRLYVDGKQKGLSDVQLAANGSDVVEFSFVVNTKGSHQGYIETDDAPISFDDRMFFAFDIASSVPVYHIAGAGSTPNMRNLFSKDSLFNFVSSSERNVDMDRMTASGLIVLDELSTLSSGLVSELNKSIETGSNVLIIPPANLDPKQYQSGFQALGIPAYGGVDTANTRVGKIDAAHPLFRGVFMTPPEQIQYPAVFTSYRLPAGAGRSVMTLLNGNPFMSEFVRGKGHIYVLAVPLQSSYSSFASNALIVPSVMQMAFSSRVMPSVAYPLDYPFGIDLPGNIISGEKPPVLVSFDGNQELIPGFSNGNPPRIFLNAQISQPGAYKVKNNQTNLMSFGLNYSRDESRQEYYTMQELKSQTGSNDQIRVMETGDTAASVLAEWQEGTKLWKIFIIFALIIFAAELILLRIWI